MHTQSGEFTLIRDDNDNTGPLWRRMLPTPIKDKFFRVDLSEGNNRYVIKNIITDYFRSPLFSKHMIKTGSLMCIVIAVFMLGGVLTAASFAGNFTKIHWHEDGSMYEFIPSDNAANNLGLVQSRMLNDRHYTFREVDHGEFKVGHIDLDMGSGYFVPPELSKNPSREWFSASDKTLDKKMDVIIGLDKLEKALENNCRNLKNSADPSNPGCSCISAPHIGIPVRAIYVKSVGMMVNPKVDVLKRMLNKRIEYSSAISEMKIDSGDVPQTVRVDYYSSWGPVSDIKKDRRILHGNEAACVYVTSIELDFKKEKIPEINNDNSFTNNNNNKFSREL